MSFNELEDKLIKLINILPGDVGVYIKFLETGETFVFEENKQFWAASVIKLPIVCCFFENVSKNLVSLNDLTLIKEENYVKGTGIVHLLDHAREYSHMDLVKLMIILSDNAATNEIIDLLGWETINSWIQSQGLVSSSLKHKMMITAGRGPNLTTASDISIILENLYYNKYPFSEDIINILNEVKLRDRIPVFLPNDIVVAHKTGSLPQAVQDVGIVYSKNSFILSFLSDDQTNKMETRITIAKIAKTCFDYSK
ncbi:MAG: serine hydrolase [Romboutsia sp.]|nr:serine hydrolase [Romboutsia sp.]